MIAFPKEYAAPADQTPVRCECPVCFSAQEVFLYCCFFFFLIDRVIFEDFVEGLGDLSKNIYFVSINIFDISLIIQNVVLLSILLLRLNLNIFLLDGMVGCLISASKVFGY